VFVKTNTQIAKELKITPIFNKLLEYKRNRIHVNRMPRNKLPRVMKHYSPTGRKNHGRQFEETSGYVRPERVNKWPNSMRDMMMTGPFEIALSLFLVHHLH
jgi:hypothetical protein